MAKKTPDFEPDELEDFPEEIASPSSERSEGLPEVSEKSGGEPLMGNLARTKKDLPSFSSQDRRQAKRMESMDLDNSNAQSLGEEIRPQTALQAKRRERREAAAEAGPVSSRDVEEALRREGGRPKGELRPCDFEPISWASPKTRVDSGIIGEHGEERPKVSFNACVLAVVDGLKRGWKQLSGLEMASVTVFIVVALAGLFVFRDLVHSFPTPPEAARASLSALEFPVEGELVNLAFVEAYWREPQPGDIVRPGMLIVPEIRLRASGRGFLRLLIRDEDGLIRGDPFAEKLEGGEQAFTILCSEGYYNRMKLLECRANRLDPWRVLIYESAEYDLPLEEWRLLAEFAMPSEIEQAR